MSKALRIVAVCAWLILGVNSPHARAESRSLDLTNTVWEGTDEEFSFILIFNQGKTAGNNLVATLKGWRNETLELRGEFSEGTPDPRVQLVGGADGEILTFDLRLKMDDQAEKPYFYGDISTGTESYHVSARCEQRCPDIGPTGEAESEPRATKQKDIAAHDLIGEWEDTSEEIGFKEYWSIRFAGGQWEISGKFVKAQRVVGEFHGVDVEFDSKKGMLYFLQVFDPKPDKAWVASNDIEASALGDKLKVKVRGVEAILTRTPNTRK